MSRKKTSILVQALALFSQVDERDKTTLAEYVKTQTATPRKASTKKPKKDTPALLTEITKSQGSSAAWCSKT